ncbi:FAD/NAD(P)-binding domain-containing protein [Saccharata proteae CBS 121410]|uniref:FAD/NAD(P)-binding domain-containing protein n=1 Tax=Saccharata proteae CBS 121410 TaxID=1314787 RepID=A0A9P4M253_9PEZI|nr:FAD/NAD(P)-binding domain-containing protein [Saccharata proteae CBS 121410]
MKPKKPKSVAIVGAGPAGLVTAKTLLNAYPPGTFNVTVLDRNHRVGGMWAVERGQRDGKVDPEMRTNLSRFTVAFSDLAWESVDLGERNKAAEADGNGNPPMFPKAWQVGWYLQTYTRKYIPDGVIQLESRVKNTERVTHRGRQMWKVEWNGYLLALTGTTYQGFFDYLIVCTGFLETPRKLDINVCGAESIEGLSNAQHSSQFRNILDLVGTGHAPKRSIVVVGGGMSGAEAAAEAALEISDAQHSPGKPSLVGDYKVYHVTPRPFYPVPRYLPSQPPDVKRSLKAPTFGPLDLRFYDLSRRTAGPIIPMNGRVAPERAARMHQYIQSFLGQDQTGFELSALKPEDEELTQPAYISISDSYQEFVRSGKIVQIQGRAKNLAARPSRSGTPKARVEAVRVRPTSQTDHPEKDMLIKNVAGVIYASGYSQTATHWLPKDVCEILHCNEECYRLPLLLNGSSTCHHLIPNLGFVGFYEGPYWGVMEMQARLLARSWLADDGSVGPASLQIKVENLKSLRTAMMQRSASVPAFWMGDYVGLMENMAHSLDIPRNDTAFSGRSGPSMPARYASASPIDPKQTTEIESAKALIDLHQTLTGINEGTFFIAAAVFRALHGAWKIDRVIHSARDDFLSGKFDGTAHFHPRRPTDPRFDAEYLYIENGTLTLESGATFPASRSYVYRYDAHDDKMSVWFVKPDVERATDYLFYEMAFDRAKEKDYKLGGGWQAQGTKHVCEEDVYWTLKEFYFDGCALEGWESRYVVRGPKKVYETQNWFRR